MKSTTVLCVDDESRVLTGLRRVIGRTHRTETVTSGAEALKRLTLQPQRYDVLLSDLRMPDMDGVQLLRRARLISPRTVRVLLTGQAELDAAIAAINDCGAFRFLTKPCAPAMLRQVIAAAVSEKASSAAREAALERTLCGAVAALSDTLSLPEVGASIEQTAAADYARLIETWPAKPLGRARALAESKQNESSETPTNV